MLLAVFATTTTFCFRSKCFIRYGMHLKPLLSMFKLSLASLSEIICNKLSFHECTKYSTQNTNYQLFVLKYEGTRDSMGTCYLQFPLKKYNESTEVLQWYYKIPIVCVCVCAVSYTHLDVYKRQNQFFTLDLMKTRRMLVDHVK